MKKIPVFMGLILLSDVSSVFAAQGAVLGNELNPAISLILEGRYTDLDQATLEIPGFQLGGEAGLPAKGFSLGHNELIISSNIDDQFYGALMAAIVEEEGETVVELEEAYIETLRLGGGTTLKAGRFFSNVGYLNSIHSHAHDFADRPLVYDVLFGGHLADTGLQARWVLPTEIYTMLGSEVTTGSVYPSGDNDSGHKGLALFAKTGGDFNASMSWQLGASYYQSAFDIRYAGGHAHSNDAHEASENTAFENELLAGEVDVAGIDFVYKWSPNGFAKQKNFKFQMEYFIRNEKGLAVLTEDSETSSADYDGKHKGFYAQTVYQWRPAWRWGVRYDWLQAKNTLGEVSGADTDSALFLEEAGLLSDSDPFKYTVMVDYAASHFSRIRLQYSQMDLGSNSNSVVMLQYTMSLGAHGGHTF
jgi:hypothetical protein